MVFVGGEDNDSVAELKILIDSVSNNLYRHCESMGFLNRERASKVATGQS